MDKKAQNPQLKEVENEISVHQDRRGRKPVNHSVIFWVGLVLILVAIIYYIVTLNLSTAP